MIKTDVINLLKANKNERGIENWHLLEAHKGSLLTFGIGLTVLRKLAKQIGRNHELANELWQNEYYDAKVISLLIDDPKLISINQVEKQVEDMKQGYLSHVFSSCNATLAKTPFVIELAEKWIISNDFMRRKCGYGLLYEISKSKKKNAPDDDFFIKFINHIENSFKNEVHDVKHSLACALMGIGIRNKILHPKALKVARMIGPIPVYSGKTKCDPFNIVKHLTSERVLSKMGQGSK